MRAVVDTNILVSGLLNLGGSAGQVVEDIVTGRLRAVPTRAVLDKYRAVLPSPHLRIRADPASAQLDLIALTADWVPVSAYAGTPPLPDPDDWPFVAATLVAGCPVITGNVKHFALAAGVRVMAAREWVEGR